MHITMDTRRSFTTSNLIEIIKVSSNLIRYYDNVIPLKHIRMIELNVVFKFSW